MQISGFIQIILNIILSLSLRSMVLGTGGTSGGGQSLTVEEQNLKEYDFKSLFENRKLFFGNSSIQEQQQEMVLDIEQTILKSLRMFNKILVTSQSSDMEDLSDFIISEYQKLVMKAKNDKISHSAAASAVPAVQDDFAASSVSVNNTDVKPATAKVKVDNAKSVPASSTQKPALKSETPPKSPKKDGATDPIPTPSKEEEIIPKLEENAVDNVLKDVAEKADSLESGLKQEKFLDGQQEEGSTIETVVKVGGEKADEKSANVAPSSSAEANTKPVVLIDSANNQYVLSKPGDATAHVEDTALMQDLLILLLVCCASGIVMYFIGLPVFFGYIIAGTILSKNRLIENAVQVETISRGLGVIFIMFYLGLEFNFSKIGKIWSVSFFGSLLLLSLTLVVSCTIFPQFVHASMSESIVIGSSIFLSSTAVVIHFLKPGESETTYGRSIMGILVAQDILLGFLLAIMPGLEQSGGLQDLAYTALRLILLSILFTTASYILRIPMLHGLSWLSKRSKKSEASAEVFLLTSICLVLLYLGLGRLFEQSIELSCFVAGVMVSTQKPLSETVSHKLESFKQIFSALFFASIGLHIYPSFLYNEGVLLVTLTLIVILFKAVSTGVVMHLVFRIPAKTAGMIGVGLAQVSEFTFVLASKAKGRGILSREFFFIVIGVTSISMFLSPFVWKGACFMLGVRTVTRNGVKQTLPQYRSVENTEDEGDEDEVGQEISARLFERRGSVMSDGPGVLSNDSLPSFKSD